MRRVRRNLEAACRFAPHVDRRICHDKTGTGTRRRRQRRHRVGDRPRGGSRRRRDRSAPGRQNRRYLGGFVRRRGTRIRPGARPAACAADRRRAGARRPEFDAERVAGARPHEADGFHGARAEIRSRSAAAARRNRRVCARSRRRSPKKPASAFSRPSPTRRGRRSIRVPRWTRTTAVLSYSIRARARRSRAVLRPVVRCPACSRRLRSTAAATSTAACARRRTATSPKASNASSRWR